jgi:hypothetical protein
MNRKLCLLSAIIALLWVYATAHAQAPQPAPTAIEESLRHIDSRKRLVRQEIAQIENRVNTETGLIMDRLDQVFQMAMPDMEKHHQDVEKALQRVTLPDDIGVIEVIWRQLKAGVGANEALEDMITRFSERAMREIESEREGLMEVIDKRVKEVLQKELPRAQENIRAPFQKILVRHFPAWEGHGLPAPPLPSINLRAEGAHGPGATMLGALGGMLILVLRKRIVKMIATKIAKQVLTKAIPVIGWLLMLHAVWDATQAKASLEQELRTQFLAVYKSEMTADALWKARNEASGTSTRDEYAREVRAQLDEWSKLCRREAERMLDVAHLYTLLPNVREYSIQQGQKGRNTLEVVEELALVNEVFPVSLIRQTSIEQLLNMIMQAPDKQELERLAAELDTRLLDEYARHGRAVLIAAHALGVRMFLEVVRSGKRLHWADVQRAFEEYPRDLPDPARRGLLLLLLEGVVRTGVRPSTLQRIADHETAFLTLAPVLKTDPGKLFETFANDQALQVIIEGYKKDAEITQACAKAWPVRTWERYKDKARRDALFQVARYRIMERQQSVEVFANEIGEQDELTFFYLDAGLDAVRLWDAHVGPQAGAHQRRIAKRAIELYKAGYPRDALLTVEGVKFADFCHRLPFVGLQVFKLLYPLAQAAYLVAVLIAIVIVAVPTMGLLGLILYLVRKPMRKTRQGYAREYRVTPADLSCPPSVRPSWWTGGKRDNPLPVPSPSATAHKTGGPNPAQAERALPEHHQENV